MVFRCGVAVHENCYMVGEPGEEGEESDHSSSSTEPWFCEPCLYGLSLPPHCELCPNRQGAFKRSGNYNKPNLCSCFLCLLPHSLASLNKCCIVYERNLRHRRALGAPALCSLHSRGHIWRCRPSHCCQLARARLSTVWQKGSN